MSVLAHDDFLTSSEIRDLRAEGLFIGDRVKISRGARLYGIAIFIGDDCRIDHGAVLSGRVYLAGHVHVGAYATLYGGDKGIWIGDYVGISPHVAMYTGSEDLTGLEGGPACDPEYRRLEQAEITVGQNCGLFSHAVLLPGASMDEDAVIAAHGVVRGHVPAYEIWGGTPARKLKDRSLLSAWTLKDATA